MTKEDFIISAREHFKTLGYRKFRNYWFAPCGDILYCVFMQNSQWSKKDYYVEVGIALPEEVGLKPTLTNWYVRKRCEDTNGYDRNVSLDDVIRSMSFFDEIHSTQELYLYMQKTPHTRIGVQFDI